eukprot:4159799-Alexandrium_andersonii.AAC.1
MAKLEEGPIFHMEEAAAPSGPAGRKVPARRSESANVGNPFSCAVPKPRGTSGLWGHRGRTSLAS